MNRSAFRQLAIFWGTFLAIVAGCAAFVICGLLLFTLFFDVVVAGIILLVIMFLLFCVQISIWTYRDAVWEEEWEKRWGKEENLDA